MKSGIYKITNPKGKVYIGKANWITRRWNEHKNPNCKSSGPKLKNSFSKYGIDKHTFEVIEECSKDSILERERFYQELYNSVKQGLNHVYTNTTELPGGVEVECVHCKSKFRRSKSHISKKNYCSTKCREESYKGTNTFSKCKCGKVFKHYLKRDTKYCSRKCYYSSMQNNKRAVK